MRIVVGIATTGQRQESLRKTVASLEDQVDEILIYDNSIEDEDLTDNGKFRFLDKYTRPIYYFSCDDDIVYPSDYVSKTIEAIETHQCIVSYHGRILRGLNRSYYKGHSSFACLHTFPQTVQIDVAGTGVTAFRTDYFNPTEIYKAEEKRMSDLVFSLEAAKQGKKMMHLGHQGKWINYTEQPKGTTIYETEHKNESKQIELANQIWLIKN
jgi:hypothetical protein